MSQLDLRLVRQVLRERLLTVPTLPPSSQMAWENQPFNPADPQGLWVRETMQRGSEPQVAWGTIEVIGRVVYDVFYPKGRGTEPGEDLQTAIANVFMPGTNLNSQGVSVHIDKTQRTQSRYPDEAWYGFGVSIAWRSYASNP